jgi:hypothetical protein
MANLATLDMRPQDRESDPKGAVFRIPTLYSQSAPNAAKKYESATVLASTNIEMPRPPEYGLIVCVNNAPIAEV